MATDIPGVTTADLRRIAADLRLAHSVFHAANDQPESEASEATCDDAFEHCENALCRLIDVRATTPEGVLIKLMAADEYEEFDCSDMGKAMIASVIADLKAMTSA